MQDKDILLQLRQKLGYSQTQLAEALNTRQQTICMIERGHRGIPKSIINLLHNKYNLDYTNLSKGVTYDITVTKKKKPVIKARNNQYKINIIGNIIGSNKKHILNKLCECFEDIDKLEIIEE